MKTRLAFKSVRWCGSTSYYSSRGSVIEEEVAKFSAVGNDWWDQSSNTGTGPLHAMNPVRVGYIRSILAAENSTSHLFESQQLKNLSILDVGCGGGLLAESLSRLGANVTAIDPSEQNIQVASRHSKYDRLTSSIKYKVATVDQIYDSNEKFDAVCSLEVVEHVENPAIFVNACTGCLRPGGSIFLSTMNKTYKSYLMAIFGAEYVLGVVPQGTHNWNKFIRPSVLKQMVEHKESVPPMRVANISGMILKPNPKLLFGAKCTSPLDGMEWAISSADLDVNYILHAVKDPASA